MSRDSRFGPRWETWTLKYVQVAQTLHLTSQSTLFEKGAVDRLGETYKAPSRKIPVKDTLILLVTWSLQIIGSGRIRNMISRIIFAIPVPSAEFLTSWHLGSLTLLSQIACTGTHSNIESRTAALHRR